MREQIGPFAFVLGVLALTQDPALVGGAFGLAFGVAALRRSGEIASAIRTVIRGRRPE